MEYADDDSKGDQSTLRRLWIMSSVDRKINFSIVRYLFTVCEDLLTKFACAVIRERLGLPLSVKTGEWGGPTPILKGVQVA